MALIAGAEVPPAVAADDDVRSLISQAIGRVLQVDYSPLNVLDLTLELDHSMTVIGFGLNHCEGPFQGEWWRDGDRVCWTTPWVTGDCFEVVDKGGYFELLSESGLQPYAFVEDRPLKQCSPE